MRKVALACATLAALLLIAVLGLGFYGQSSSAQTKNELAEETEIAHELLQVKQAAEAQNADQLVNLTDEKLAQLPASSRELAAENSDSAKPLTEALTSSSNNLLETAYSTDDAQLRVFLFDSSLQLWDAGVKAKTVEGEYPTAVAGRVAASLSE